MAKPKVLYVCHNHPAVRPGGAETYALELYEGMRAVGEFEPVLLAKGGPPISTVKRPHEGTLLASVNDDPNQYFFYTDGTDFDWFYGTSRNKDLYVRFFDEFLTAQRPSVVHFQHTLFLGYDIIRQTRNSLPRSAIVYTLHEFVPICHRNGQMIRTHSEELCSEASPRRCHECFPDITPQAFFMRKRFIQSHLALVDQFLAPSRFLVERYVKWGIPRDKIRYEENGRPTMPAAGQDDEDRPRNRLGFFGQFTMYKGVHILLKAMRILADEQRGAGPGGPGARRGPTSPTREIAGGAGAATSGVHLWLHGGNLELQPGAFQNEFSTLVEACPGSVTMVGRYERSQVARLMANVDWVVVPSIWWENAPLVIQEAFLHGRPVICSDIGGMAEKVADGENGLHFRTGDAVALADTIRRAVTSPGLWDKLRSGIPRVYGIDDHVRSLSEMYRGLLGGRRGDG